MLEALLYAALMACILFITSLTFARLAHRINRHGYVPGSVIATSAPGLLVLIGFGLLSYRLLPPSWQDLNLVLLGLSFVLGLCLGLFGPSRETTDRTRKK